MVLFNVKLYYSLYHQCIIISAYCAIKVIDIGQSVSVCTDGTRLDRLDFKKKCVTCIVKYVKLT